MTRLAWFAPSPSSGWLFLPDTTFTSGGTERVSSVAGAATAAGALLVLANRASSSLLSGGSSPSPSPSPSSVLPPSPLDPLQTHHVKNFKKRIGLEKGQDQNLANQIVFYKTGSVRRVNLQKK